MAAGITHITASQSESSVVTLHGDLRSKLACLSFSSYQQQKS